MLRSEQNLANAVGGLVVDFLLLSLMLAGLVRRREARRFGLWQVLWKQVRTSPSHCVIAYVKWRLQGLVWIFIASVAEIPSVIFLKLNLNSKRDGPLDERLFNTFYPDAVAMNLVRDSLRFLEKKAH